MAQIAKLVFSISLLYDTLEAVWSVIMIDWIMAKHVLVHVITRHGIVCVCRNIYLAFFCDNTKIGVTIDMVKLLDIIYTTMP